MNQISLKRYIKIGYFLLFAYAIYVFFVLFSSGFSALHFTITSVALVFISILLLIVAILEKNKFLIGSAISFIMLFIFEMISLSIGLYEQDVLINPTVDIIFHLLFFITMGTFTIGAFQFMILMEKRKYIHHLAFENSRAIYIEYDHVLKKYVCEFTKSFSQTHHIKKQTHIYTKEEFIQFVKETDKALFIEIFSQDHQKEYTQVNIKFPGFEKYLLFVIYATYQDKKTYWIAFDITDVESMKKQLALTKTQLSELSLASKKVIENTNELIATVDPNGNIIQASNRYCEIFDCDPEKIAGTYVNSIGKKYQKDNEDWVKEIIEKKITHRVIEYKKNGEIIIISWKNVALTDAFGNTKSIMSLGEDITKLTNLQKSIEYQANYNQVTHLLNKNGLDKAIKNLKYTKDLKSAACFVIDIDDFYKVIDYYGVKITDKLLYVIGQNLKQLTQEKDIISNHMEDQFVLIFKNPSKVFIESLIDQLQEIIIKSYTIDDVHIQVKKRIGYALYKDDTDDLDEFIHYASLASYHQNDSAYNQITKYDPSMKKNLEKNIILSNRLYDAISNDKIDVHMQRIIDGRNNDYVYIEALARWKDEIYGFICPDDFFNIARKSSLIELLELHLVKKSLSYFKALKENQIYEKTKLSLNLTPEMFLKKGFAELLNDYTKENHIDQKDVIVEVSENTFVHNLNVCNKMIKTFKDYGFLIAIDDFGSKYSSLAVLETIDYDIIKIDGSFINNLNSKNNLEIVKMIAQIGRTSNKIIIAEKVETKEISQILIDNSINLQQGYYFHKPEKLI